MASAIQMNKKIEKYFKDKPFIYIDVEDGGCPFTVESEFSRLLNVPCPNCGCDSLFFINFKMMESVDKPVPVSPMSSCDNCGAVQFDGYKYFRAHIKNELAKIQEFI